MLVTDVLGHGHKVSQSQVMNVRGRDRWHFRAEALGIEVVRLHAFLNLVFEPRAGVSHYSFVNVLTAAASEHAGSRKDLRRGILRSPCGVPSVRESL